MIDHLSIQCADVSVSAAFYDGVLAPLGGTRVMDFGTVVGFGVAPKPEFWLGLTCRRELSKSDLAMKLITPLRENRASAVV